MSDNFSYPSLDDKDFLSKIYNKREFYAHKIIARDKLNNYDDIKKYRESVCKGDFKLREQQILLTNFISPDNPYKGILIMHGTGTGKTCTAISIAEQFKSQVKKYNTKIFILTFGPNNKETFKDQLLFCTGETYIKNKNILSQMTKSDKEKDIKIATYGALQYYKILSYKTFYKKVLGEKIIEKKVGTDNKIKTSYKRDTSGIIEREIVIDKINNMNNSIIIVDEAHNLTGNEYGEALKLIIKNSENLKVILLSATPMKNLADDIIDILNFLRPPNNPIKRELVFTGEKNYNMELKPGGIEYFKKMANGYISYFRGNMPYTFADRIDKGEIPEELLYTPLIRCYMESFQKKSYDKTKEIAADSLERSSSAVANFVFPGLNSDNTKLKGLYSTDGLSKFINQFQNYKNKTLNLINSEIFNNKLEKNILDNFIKETDNKLINGDILKLKYLKYFSTKFYTCINNLNKLFKTDNNSISKTGFVYSNLVKAGGIELFAECLKENGYLEYNLNFSNYIIKDETIDAVTGMTFKDYKLKKLNLKFFNPATYLLITGGNEDGDDLPEIKQKIIRNTFNNIENRTGKFIKLILGSKVMNEGVTLANVGDVHLLDVHYNLGKVEQVIGRAIRMCKHQDIIDDKNRFPEVNVYRYVISIKNKITSDEDLYRKAELKFLLVKKIERAIKTIAVDCPILYHGNKFPEEIEKYKNCKFPTLENKKKGEVICPLICDFEECDFKCDNEKLNKLYYDDKNGTYRNLKKKEINYNTFSDQLARNEIDNIKSIIKDLYKFNYVYVYEEFKKNIFLVYNNIQKEIFDRYFLDKALKDLMPESENDFNNFKDTIFDKFNRIGYLIRRNKYYIFQPFDENEDLPIYYRKNISITAKNNISLEQYIIHKYGSIKTEKEKKNKILKYDFNTNKDYYLKRSENFIVGIIDKNKSNVDVFKIRPPLPKSEKRRGTGIYSLKGAVCATSKDKDFLLQKLKKLDKTVKISDKIKRDNICNLIKETLLKLEKYSTDDKTYIIIPSNHPDYEFPYNLKDRVKYTIKNILKLTKKDLDHTVKKSSKYYDIIIKVNSSTSPFIKDIQDMGFKLEKKELIKRIE
uniref:Early transcription factor 70 kDa subunit n=1 Tax=Megaviridae environmental sample TaxID=1737588 RepID=A0A5J6VLC3_9VIRU|nr:MAG: type III restriction enzyme, res subunit [Megaviridae environmental sample]